jgi:transglutaminase-like putative cysteine protease
MTRLRVLHVTTFAYDAPVSESYNEVHLQPRDDELQTCLVFRLTTRPASQPGVSRDYLGNWVHRFNVLSEHRRLRIEAESIVMLHDPHPVPADGPRLAALDAAGDGLHDEHHDFMVPSVYVPQPEALADLVRAAEAEAGGSVLGFVRAATALVHTRFRYEKGATHVHSSITDVLASGVGVCQDFAHLLLGVARRRGLPARYVSGYLVPRAARERPASGIEEVIGGQASHAWVEVMIPELGWIPFDPTLGRADGGRHVRVAYGRDYGDVAPVRGVYKGHAGQRLRVDVRVRPALDDEGEEHWRESGLGLIETPPVSSDAPQQ